MELSRQLLRVLPFLHVDQRSNPGHPPGSADKHLSSPVLCPSGPLSEGPFPLCCQQRLQTFFISPCLSLESLQRPYPIWAGNVTHTYTHRHTHTYRHTHTDIQTHIHTHTHTETHIHHLHLCVTSFPAAGLPWIFFPSFSSLHPSQCLTWSSMPCLLQAGSLGTSPRACWLELACLPPPPPSGRVPQVHSPV